MSATSLGLVLYPGAGSGADHPGLVAIEEAVAPRRCARVDFEYRLRGRRAPARAPQLMAEVRRRLTREQGRLVLGGRSMGGRIASMVTAGADGSEVPPNVVGLVLVAYPLHPPGRPDRCRVEHLPHITVPCLFVSGTRDPFGTPGELEAATAAIPADVRHVWIDGAGHDLRGADDEVAAAVVDFLARLETP